MKLKSLKNCTYDIKYYHKIQGLIYSLIRDTPFSLLHDKKGYKYFCFSNIFPIGDIKKNDERNLIISSPSDSFINIIEEKIKILSEQDKAINIGEYQFKLERISKEEFE